MEQEINNTQPAGQSTPPTTGPFQSLKQNNTGIKKFLKPKFIVVGLIILLVLFLALAVIASHTTSDSQITENTENVVATKSAAPSSSESEKKAGPWRLDIIRKISHIL